MNDTVVRVRRSKTERMRLTHASLKDVEIAFRKDRARELLGRLYRDFTRGGGAKEDIAHRAPQWVHRPPALEFASPEHRRWLFFAASTDVREDSHSVYATHRALWEDHRSPLPFRGAARSTRELYEESVLTWEREDYISALAKSRIGNPRRNIDWWGRRARTLWGEWGGDPYGMFSSGSIDGFLAWKDAARSDLLPGVGPKIASLISIFLEETGLPGVPDAFPVDVHVQSIALSLGLLEFAREGPVLNDALERTLRKGIAELSREEGWSRVHLSHALWFRGHHGCRGCSRRREMPLHCPVYSDCRGRYASGPYFRMGLWMPHVPPAPRGGDRVEGDPDPLPLFASADE